MKKTLAFASASAMGVGIVALGGAGVAQAAPVVTPCTDATEHQYTVGELGDNWFMDCIPQYGTGKAEFTVTTTETLPADFLPLNEPGVTSTFSGNAVEGAAYFGATGQPNGFVELTDDGDILEYLANPIFPIAAVGNILTSELPAGCEPGVNSFGNAYRVDYEPITTTFTQTTDDGAEWTVDVTFTPQSVYLGFNFAAAQDGSLDPDLAQCIANDTVSFLETTGNAFNVFFISAWALLDDNVTMPPWPDGVLTQMDIGDFPLERSGPGLANTGAEVSTVAIAGGAAAMLAGLGLVIATSRARRKRDTSA